MHLSEKIHLAHDYHQAGNLKQSVDVCLEILKIHPDNAIILHLLGVISFQAQNYDRAISYFRQAVQFEPRFAEAYNNLGIVLNVMGQLDEAIASYQKAIELNPNYADAHYNLGNAFIIKERLDEAIISYQKALQLNPGHAVSYNNLGNALREKGLLDEAITCYRKALDIDPNLFVAFNNLGIISQEKGQLDEALTSYQKALQLNPNYADAYNNLGFALQEKGQLNEAIRCYKKALQLNPSLAGAHGHLSLALLLKGDYEQGWKEYAWRWKTKYSYMREFPQPLWDGSDITGLTILLHAEQGMGDTIQFIRFVPLVAERGARIIVECHKELTSLLKNVAGIGQAISFGEQLPAFDLHCPLLSLPSVFGTTLESIPVKIPYIKANPALIQKWRDNVQSDNAKLNIGLTWAGSPRYKENRNRSLSLDIFSSLSQIENIAFYSLQKGEAAEQAKNPPKGMNFIDLTKEIHDFADTAALIENLDLVISADTAVAHLAGAMGKPVWTLIPFSPDWRWLLNREDSPWYPTMKLFRQPAIGDWKSVIAKIADQLKNILNVPELIRLALQHYQSRNLQLAEQCLKKVLETQPDNGDVLYFLGIICTQQDNYDLAMEHIKRSLECNPANADAYFALGTITKQKGLTVEAIRYFRKTLHLNPGHCEAYNELGNALKEKGLLDEAVACYQKAIKLSPANADIYHNLGMSLQAKGLINEAIRYYRKAIQINPQLPRTYNNLGIVLQQKGDFDEALSCYQKALLIDPDLAETHYNLGNLLKRQGKHDKASAAYDVALAINPNYFTARWAKCMCQLPIIHPDQASINIAREHYYEELINLRQSFFPENPQNVTAAAEAVGVDQPFYLAYHGCNDRELQKLYGELVCRIMSCKYPHFSIRPAVPPRSAKEPLRVGIVSGCFYHHPVWKIIIKGWIANLDKDNINLFGYYTGTRQDQETNKTKHYFTQFVEHIYSFEDLCSTIINHKLHVIIYPEIGMDPTTVRLASLRLAPIQCASWGHPDTSGLPTIDYYLSSDLMEPPDGDDHYSERLVRLPNLSIHYTPDDIPHSEASRNIFGLRSESVLYHCCQTLFKFLPQYDEIFPRIAQQVGNCQFLFSSLPEISSIIEQFRIRISRTFNQFNLNANDYIVFLPHLDQVRYNALNRLADIFLDPVGWSGCTSTLEAIDCNLPVITLPGPFMRGRESSAILTMMGLTMTIATSVDEYVELAVTLGLDTEWRRLISRKIAENKHIIYGDRSCITALEDFLQAVVSENIRKQ